MVLREKLGFRGLVFSDDLSMAGASTGRSIVDRASRALSAGCDLVLVCNDTGAQDTLLASGESLATPDAARMETLRRSIHRDQRRGPAYRDAQSALETLRAIAESP
jgi:beta-N-acetylhexosaminidase